MKFLFPLFAFVFFSCIQHQTNQQIDITETTDTVEVLYAQGFEVNYKNGCTEIITHHFADNSPFADTVYVLTDSLVKLPENAHVIQPEKIFFACHSSTHLAFLNALNCIEKVKGLCGMQYISGTDYEKKLNDNGAFELCLQDQVIPEKIQQTGADLFLMYPFESIGKEKYSRAGIKTFFIAEYLETDPLARLEWIKLFGLLTNQTSQAQKVFDLASTEYLQLKKEKPETTKKFILNLPYGETWFMPSSQSLLVNLIQSSGLSYFYPPSGKTENDVHSLEQVWNDGIFADYWIIIAGRDADFSLHDLSEESPVYAEFKSVKKKQVIFCNTNTTEYFTTGVIEPHVLLKDLLYAQGELSNHQPVYFRILE
ncbi:MAG: ABC transporter substrate-binding protein [Crocinitomicaceae bacterium]|nr:ABC transporter substrate-binding protein [Crocinitomicaceae bacterium]